MLYKDFGPCQDLTKEIKVPENTDKALIKQELPIKYFHGSQPLHHPSYSAKSRRRIERKYAKDSDFLSKNPIIAVAIIQSDVLLAVHDGHNRLRFVGHLGLTHIPAVIYSVEQVAKASNIPEDDIIRCYKECVSYAAVSFSQAISNSGKQQTMYEPLPMVLWKQLLKDSEPKN